MQILKTKGEFEYFHIIEKRMIKTQNEIPFIIGWNGKLENEINQYLIFKTETDWNPTSKTPINNAEQILAFLDFCQVQGIDDWKTISATDLKKYISYMTKNGNKGSTIKTKISTIHYLFDWLERFSFIKQNPFNVFHKKEVSRIVNVFSSKQKTTEQVSSSLLRGIVKDAYKEDIPSQTEVKAFYKELSEEDKLMASIIIGSGIRKSELLQLRIKDIKEARESYTGNSYTLLLDSSELQIKYNKSRNIVISRSLYVKIMKHLYSQSFKNKLAKYLDLNPLKQDIEAPIFISVRGNAFSSDKLNKSFKKASSQSGYIEKHGYGIAPHHLRHFFASTFIYEKEKEGEVNMEDAYMYLAERLGHSSVETTKAFYVKIVSRIKQQEQIEKFSETFINGFLED